MLVQRGNIFSSVVGKDYFVSVPEGGVPDWRIWKATGIGTLQFGLLG